MTTQLNYYTFYLMNGKRKVFLGTSPEDAYLNNQSYKDGQRAIAIQEQGITLNHVWDKHEDAWVPSKPFKVSFNSLKGISKLETFLAVVLVDKNTIIIEFDNKCQLALSVEWGHFAFGWTHYMSVSYLEYQKGNYDSSDSDGCHYFVTNTQYFKPENGNDAVSTFVKRLFSTEPSSIYGDKSQTLEDIHSEQSSFAMYDPKMTDFEKVWLLGSLLKRFDNLPEIMKYVQNKYISRPLCKKDAWISEIMNQIFYLCADVLISDKGQRAYSNEKFITDFFHFKFEIGEQDSCGPLSMIIKLNNVNFVYA